MPLISLNATAQTPTQQAQAAIRQRIASDIEALFRTMLDTYNRNMAAVWQDATLTPQQVLDTFGTDGAELFRLAGLLKGTLNAAVPGTVPDAVVPNITVGTDGRVTINQA